jgi:serine/threonine-protein kinase HipA
MHTHHDDERHRSALDINGKIDYAELGTDDLIAEGRSWGLPAARAARVVNETVESVRAAIDAVDLDKYPGVSERALATIQDRATRAAEQLAARATEN